MEVMEQSISSLAFKGSIIEAITEAKRQKKLFLVYISGDNEDSIFMDKSTWSDSSVAESLSKYCILLHILEGSTDAAQFSALYPQKPAPCITAIGYNGIQVWQNEGFVSGEILTSTLEKAWLSLHVQETTATFLSAALASRQSEQIPSEAPPTTTSSEIGSSSSTSSTTTNASASMGKKDVDHTKEKSESSAPEEVNLKRGNDVPHVPSVVDKPVESNIAQPATPISEPNTLVTTSENVSGVDKKSILKVSVEGPRKSENLETQKADNLDVASNISTDIYLNIRLPGGTSLQEKFEPTSTLRMVKDYVDQKKETNIGAYDLAIPYPRKVFGDQDLSKTLAELSLLNRQALIVVPRVQSTRSYSIPNPSGSTIATSSSPNNQGYFSYWKSLLSYVNPLAYLTPTNPNPSTPVQDTRNLPESGSTQTQGSRRSYLVTQNQTNNPSSSRFGSGSNIHTLKHDEDDSKFRGKNAFWNGNSTEYGGDGDNK